MLSNVSQGKGMETTAQPTRKHTDTAVYNKFNVAFATRKTK